MSRNPVVRILLAVALFGILTGDAALVVLRSDGDRETGDSAGPVGGARGPVHPDPLPPDSPLTRALPELEAFVEQARGLRFKRRVPVQLLSGDEFTARLREVDEPRDQREIDADAESFEGFLRVLGLADDDLDLGAVDAAIEEHGILGFYDPEEEALYVRGTSLGPLEELILVHELTHALEDQHFDLDRPDLDERTDEAAESFLALVEGSAVVVEQRFLDSLPPDRRRLAEEGEEAAGDAGDVPAVIDALFGYPYRDGPVFVDRLLQAGGPARLDAALADPPTTSEQVLHPELFLAGEGPKPVGPARADGTVEDSGVLGERILALVLAEAVGPSAGRRAAAGWGGDRYAIWSAGNRTCIRWNLVMDTPADTAELVSALRRFAAAHPGARVEATDPVVMLRNCA